MAKAIKEEKLSLQEIMKNLDKAYGKNSVIAYGGDYQVQTYDVIPTGSFKIDEQLLGIGGIPRGKVTLIKGESGAGKTTFCGHLVANCQKLGLKVLFIDGESAMDGLYFSQLGVNLDDETFLLCQPENGEQGYDTALKLMDSGEIGLVIIDSDSSLVPKAMMEGEVGQNFIGKKASLNSQTYPKLKVAAKKHNVAVVSIFQYRLNPGQMFGDPRTLPGGKAAIYWADIIIELTASLKKDGDETSGTINKIKTTKNKTYKPYRLIELETEFGVGFVTKYELIALAKEADLLSVRIGQVKYKDVRYENYDAFLEFLANNPDEDKFIKDKIKGVDVQILSEEEIEKLKTEDEIIEDNNYKLRVVN